MSNAKTIVVYEVASPKLGAQYFSASKIEPVEKLLEIIEDFNSPKGEQVNNLRDLRDLAEFYGFITIDSEKLGKYTSKPIKLKVQI